MRFFENRAPGIAAMVIGDTW